MTKAPMSSGSKSKTGESGQSMPVALTIAGSDSSAGAGLQADLKTFSALGVYGLTAVTCVVAEVPGRVAAIQAMEPEIVAEQIRLSFDAFPVAALKTGMLFSRAIITTVCATLETLFATLPLRPLLVVDPVMVATSGDALLEPEAVALYRERLIPLADLVTPNLDEVRTLLGRPVENLEGMRVAGQELAARYGRAFLIKGGHLRTAEAVDFLVLPDGHVHEFSAPYVEGVSTHGTGCTYAAAITAGLARGLALPEAVGLAKEFVTRAITQHLRWQGGTQQTDALNYGAVRRSGIP